MRVLRDWLGWAVGWVLVAEAPMWVGVALDAWRERSEPTLEPMPVTAWVPAVSYVAAAGVSLGLLLLLVGLGSRSTGTRRLGMLVGAAGLAAGAIAFGHFPDGVVGPWTVGLTALMAGCALLAAAFPSDGQEIRASSVLPGLALVGSGVFAAWTCWRGGSYWDWRGQSALTYQVGLGASAVLVLLGATAARWADLAGRPLRALLVAGGILGTFWFVAGSSYLFGRGALYRWEEIESPWDFGAPFLLLGVGLVAAAVAGWRRRGDLVAWSLASATSFCLLSLWQQPTWGSVMS